MHGSHSGAPEENVTGKASSKTRQLLWEQNACTCSFLGWRDYGFHLKLKVGSNKTQRNHVCVNKPCPVAETKYISNIPYEVKKKILGREREGRSYSIEFLRCSDYSRVNACSELRPRRRKTYTCKRIVSSANTSHVLGAVINLHTMTHEIIGSIFA